MTTLFDGSSQADDPYPLFGENQRAENIAALMHANFLPEDRFVTGFTSTLVNTGTDLILFDTGFGELERRNGLGRMRQQLQRAGYAADQVSVVVLTHFHPDHIGGLMEAGQPAYPNARYVVGRKEYDFWIGTDSFPDEIGHFAGLAAAMVKPLAKNMVFVEDGTEIVSGITSVAAFGHTPGHMAFLLESAGHQLMLFADSATHFVISLQQPDWFFSYDMDKTTAAATRWRMFDMIAIDRIPFIGYHMPYPAIGFAEKSGMAYRYVPESYQLRETSP